MFAIYNLQGRTFRNSLEQLQKVYQPHANEAASLHENTAQDETLVIQGTEQESQANAKSINAYRKMLNVTEREQIIHTYQIMSHPVFTLQSDFSLSKAFELFEHHEVQQMPVVSPQNHLVGMLSYQQVYKNQMSAQLSKNTAVADLIDQQVITADPVSDVRRVARVLYQYQLGALPVVNEQDHLVGIISKTDLLKAIMREPPLSLWT